MFRWCWWNRSPYMLLDCWPILIFVNLYFIVKITHLMDAAAGRTGAKRVRNARAGRGRRRRGWVRVRRVQVVFVCVGWGRKWVRLVFLFMALTTAVRRGGGTGPSALRNSTGRGSSPK